MERYRGTSLLWFAALALLTITLWFGCEQKGDVSPTGTGQRALLFLDTIVVDPMTIGPSGTALVSALVLDESDHPTENENVRFSVNRGVLAGNRPDTTIASDSAGWVRTSFTAPADTGGVLLRTELLSMGEARTTTIYVSSSGAQEGSVTVWAERDTLFADNGASRSYVYARVRNEAHNPIRKVPVHFSTTIGTITSPAYTDSLTGTATATMASTTELGPARVVATYGSSSDTLTIVFLLPSPAARIEVSSSQPQLTAGRDSAAILARVYDAANLPIVDNTLVFFSTTRGTLRYGSGRTVSGVVQTTLYASNGIGVARVSATTGADVTGSVEVDIVSGPTASVVVSSTADTLFADNSSEAEISALCRDVFGNPVSEGTPVHFEAQGGTVNESALVGPDGRARATFRAGLSMGTATVTASQAETRGSVTIYLRATAPASISLYVNPVQLTADGTSQSDLRALVLDAENRPVSDGTPVRFTAIHGQVSGGPATASGATTGMRHSGGRGESAVVAARFDGRTLSKPMTPPVQALTLNPLITSTYTTTTVNGFAYATLTSPTLAGRDTVTADVEDQQDAQTVTYVAGNPAAIRVTPAQSQLPADGISSTPVLCQVADAFGNPVSAGIAIGANSTLGRVSPAAGYTNGSGEFTTNLVTSRQQGLCAIVAQTEGANGYGEVQFVAPQVAGVSLTSEQPAILADGVSSTIMAALARDNYGLPVGGATVDWTASPGPGWLVPNASVTDSNGLATATLYSGASRTDAQRQITATVGNHSDTRTVRMLGILVSTWLDVSQMPADGQSTAPVYSQLREASSGVAIMNAIVRLAASAGSIANSAVTDSSGVATASYRAASSPGPVTITCVYGDTLRAATSLQLTGIEPDSVHLVMSASELRADGMTSTAVTATVYNEGGEAVGGVPVTFTVLGPGSIYPTQAVTDGEGRAVVTYRSAALPADAFVDVEAAIERGNETGRLLLRGISIQVDADDPVLPANGVATTEIRVQLQESASHVAIPGATVQFGSSLGIIPASETTDESGIAVVTFTTGSEPGEAMIIARFGNVLTDTTLVVLFAPSPNRIALNADRASLLGSGEDNSALTVVVTDQAEAPVANAEVQWLLNGNGSLLSSATRTDAEGRTINQLTSGATESDDYSQVVVQIGSVSDTANIVVRGLTLSLTSGAAMLAADGIDSTYVQAHLRETTSLEAIANATVRFGASMGYIAAEATTGASGQATVTLISSTSAGIANIISRYGSELSATIPIQFYEPVVDRISVMADSTSLRADGNSTTNVVARVADQLNRPLVGVTVNWMAALGTLSPVQTITDENGLTRVIFLTSASNSDLVVTVTASAGDRYGSVLIQERGVTVTVTAIPNMLIADGNSTALIRAHVYETSTFVGISNARVSFGTTLGTIPNSDLTDASGIAAVLLTSSTQTGTAQVEARYGNTLTAVTPVVFAPSTPTTLSLTASPTVLLADNTSTSTLTAVVTDQNGNPVPNGTQVRFNIPAQGGSLENLRTTISGVANNTLTSSSTPDTVQITAWAEANPSARDSVRIVYIVGPAAVITLAAQSDSLRADGIAVDTITAHVTDAVGHTLSNVEVLFQTTIGNITASRVTDANGSARVAFSSSQTGTALITARAGSASSVYTLYLIPGAPNSIMMEYFPSSVGVRGSGRNETLLVTATVRDANNNPVIDGTEVTFNINNSPGGGDFLSTYGPIPTINGRASVSYSSGTISGSVRIRAVCETVSAVSTEILIFAGPPFIENIYDGCVTSHLSLAPVPCNMFGMDVVGDTISLVALVGDRYNNPVTPGTAVYFTTSAGVITTSTGYTDSSGFVRVRMFSGHPLPTIDRWMNTLVDPNLGGPMLCSPTPTQPGMAKVLATTAGVDENGDSVIVWASTDVVFDYSWPILHIRSATVNGDPDERTLYIGEYALIQFALYDPNYWSIVYGSTVTFSAGAGRVFPQSITINCPSDTLFAITFFNNLTTEDNDAASPVLISVNTRYGDAYTFTETFTLIASLPPEP